MSFDEVQFPTKISMDSTGGPNRQTQIVVMGSGAEARNSRWRNSRRSYDVGYGLHSMNDLHTVIAFFEARNGRLIGFRFKDWSDYKSCGPDSTPTDMDQILSEAVGASPPAYQLSKTYTSGPSSYIRKILKPVAGTVILAKNGIAMPSSAFTVDTTTGLIHFTVFPNPISDVITAGYQFDTPVRFDTDNLKIDLKEFNAGVAPSIPMMELFDGT